ncbi:TRAP transporter small permease [Palleronia sp. LCG004]|uniref:TRAP transporter small permease n=1 Tax=Palleronia sp. LCG004 TaxID=3079304 RepID=UPI002943DDEF|nr:TRAP transporter small permease [Palleronia sp. LCG004]WOI57523.1 TRAP transporter small permease [Palleronia sp. LCG004]
MKRLEEIFVAANGWALIAILAAMPLIVGANISLRYLTGHSLPWADEAARYLMIWMTFGGAGLALRVGGHVAITNLQDALPGRLQKILRGVICLGLLVFFAFMVQVGVEYALRMQSQLTPALRMPFLYVYAAMPVGFGLLIVHLLFIARPFVMAGEYKPGDEDAALPDAQNG